MSRDRATAKPTTPAPLSFILAGVLKRMEKGGRPSLEEVDSIWEQLVGKEGARHSWPKRLVGRRLVVEVENSGWMYALGMKKAQLLEGLIELLGAGCVKVLALRIGEQKDA